jgi:hypothetical protein
MEKEILILEKDSIDQINKSFTKFLVMNFNKNLASTIINRIKTAKALRIDAVK